MYFVFKPSHRYQIFYVKYLLTESIINCFIKAQTIIQNSYLKLLEMPTCVSGLIM